MNDLGSLLFYILFFILSSIFYYMYVKFNKKLFLLLSFFIPMVIGGFRYYVGTDYGVYINLYNSKANIDLGFSVISKIASLFYGYKSLFFIYNFLTLLFIYLGLNNINKKIRPLAYVCYLFLYFTLSFNIVRQSLSVAIVFYAYKFLLNKDLKKWILFLFLAFCFHNTAIICLPLYFILNTKNTKLKFMYVLLTLFISLNYIDIINLITRSLPFMSHFEMYAVEIKELANNRMFFLDMAILFYMLLFRKKLVKNDKNNSVYMFMYILFITFELTGFFNPYVKRFGNYLVMSQVILLGNIPFLCKLNKNKLFNCIVIIGYSIAVFIISAYFLKLSDIIPYNFLGGQ